MVQREKKRAEKSREKQRGSENSTRVRRCGKIREGQVGEA